MLGHWIHQYSVPNSAVLAKDANKSGIHFDLGTQWRLTLTTPRRLVISAKRTLLARKWCLGTPKVYATVEGEILHFMEGFFHGGHSLRRVWKLRELVIWWANNRPEEL